MRPSAILVILVAAGTVAGISIKFAQDRRILEAQLAAARASRAPADSTPASEGPAAPLTGDPTPQPTTEGETLLRQIESLQDQIDTLRDQNTALTDLNEDLERRLSSATNTDGPDKIPAAPDEAHSNIALAERVSSLRQLPWAEIPTFAESSEDDLRSLAESKFRAAWPEAYLADRARAYSALGFLDSAEVDFAKVHAGLIAEQVSGVYDPKKTTYFTFKGDVPDSDNTRAHRVHDLAEILIAQHHDLAAAGIYATGNEDAALAALCLYLGDAGLVSSYNILQERAQPSYEPGPPPAERTPFLRAPEHLKQRHIFAYEMGGYFAQSLHESGGFEKVDAAYKNPPRSTTEVLHFNLYGKFRPVPIAFDRTDVRGEKPFWDNVVGEAGTELLLARRVPQSDAKEAANGWQGDRWLVYDGKDDGDQLLWRSLWKDEAQAARFFSSMRKFLVERYALAFKPEYNQPDGSFQVIEAGSRRLLLHHLQGSAEVTLIDASTDTWLEALRATFL